MGEQTSEQPNPADDDSGAASNANGESGRKQRRTSLFPASTFEDALGLAEAIFKAAGQSIRRITLLDQLQKSPTSSATRQWITNSSKYGLTTGSHTAETLALTPLGQKTVDDSESTSARTRARFQLAIEHVEVFKQLYEKNLDNRLPVPAVLMDQARELNVPEADVSACVETFTVNAKFIGVLRTLAGAERLISLDTLVDDFLPPDANKASGPRKRVPAVERIVNPAITSERPVDSDLANTCFYVTPIGDEESEARKHADLFMGSLLEPALAEFGLHIVRADQIGEAGMITRQIIEYIVHSKLVIADLSFHNPNVFYELALRHAVRKPIVQISRAADRLPFDIGQLRTVVVDTTDIYTLVPQLASLQAQIATQVRKTFEEGAEVENPLSVFAPTFWSNLPGRN
jgi:hypothetical protein